MSELANYSIETDHIVLLAFRDGRRLRVPIGQLAHHLAPPDLEKVRAAIKLRNDFIRRHMPKVVLALAAAGGLVAALAVGGHAVANLWSQHSRPEPAPSSTGLVRSESLPHPAPTAAAQPPSQGIASTATGVTAVAINPIHRLVSTKKPPVGNVIKSARVTVGHDGSPSTPAPTISTPTPSPSPTPTPQVAQNVPVGTPGPTPTPTPLPNSGQVLGCSSSDPASCNDGSTAPTIP